MLENEQTSTAAIFSGSAVTMSIRSIGIALFIVMAPTIPLRRNLRDHGRHRLPQYRYITTKRCCLGHQRGRRTPEDTEGRSQRPEYRKDGGIAVFLCACQKGTVARTPEKEIIVFGKTCRPRVIRQIGSRNKRRRSSRSIADRGKSSERRYTCDQSYQIAALRRIFALKSRIHFRGVVFCVFPCQVSLRRCLVFLLVLTPAYAAEEGLASPDIRENGDSG